MTAPEPAGPAFRDLADWIDGRLDGAAAERLAEAVTRGGDETRAAADWLIRFRRAAASMPLEEVPPIVSQTLRQHFAARKARPHAQPPAPAATMTRLVFDSRRDLDFVGVRAYDDLDGDDHLAFTAPGADLVVDVLRSATGTVVVQGQVFVDSYSSSATVFAATAEGDGWTSRSVESDALGRFRMANIQPDEIRLRVSNGEIALVALLDLRTTPTS